MRQRRDGPSAEGQTELDGVFGKDNFTRTGDRYDIIMDTAGTAPYARSERSLKKGGRLLLVLGSLPDMLQAPWVSMTTDKKIIAGAAGGGAEDLRFLASLAELGRFRPVIDRRYPFEQVVEAHRYVDTGRKRGNVVLTPCSRLPAMVSL